MLIAHAAAEQQPEGWRFVPDTILPGWAPKWVPARTPTVHWGPISGKAVGGPNTVQHSRSQRLKHPKQGEKQLERKKVGEKSWSVAGALPCTDASVLCTLAPLTCCGCSAAMLRVLCTLTPLPGCLVATLAHSLCLCLVSRKRAREVEPPTAS